MNLLRNRFRALLVPLTIMLLAVSGCQNPPPELQPSEDPMAFQRTCTQDSDCVPEPVCHPQNCINKQFQENMPEVCTEEFDPKAAYEPSDCVCRESVCVNTNLPEPVETPTNDNNGQNQNGSNGNNPNNDNNENNTAVSIKSEFPNKIVYAAQTTEEVAPYREDCQDRGGTFNECGSQCGPTADFCAEVCVYICELNNNETDNGLSYGGTNNTELPLIVPENFEISVFTDQVPNARVLSGVDGQGNRWVSRTDDGVIALLEINGDEVTNVSSVFTGLNNPHGLALDPQDRMVLYYAESNGVYRVRLYTEDEPEKLVDLPGGGRHFTRTIMFGSDDRLYISIGSSCDVCEEEDERRATIYVMDKDGSNFELFADGLRNAVFMAMHPVTGEIWATEMGRDNLGDNLPPDEINIVREGNDYGWPICYGKNVHDTQFDENATKNPCTNKTPAHINLQAHSAPLGLDFIPEEGWPENMWYDLFVAYHGSWNREEPTGYKVAKIPLNENGEPEGATQDFISGWLTPEGEKLGRPVDIVTEPGGIMYITDDEKGMIYRVTYQNPDMASQDNSQNTDNDQDVMMMEVANPDKGLTEITIQKSNDPKQIQITGQALGTWFFEGTFLIELIDEDQNTITQTQAQAQEEWTTEEPVRFEATLELEENESWENASIIFQKANPSGLPENNDQWGVKV